MARKEIAIIGLGKFGFFLAQSLVDLGHTVLGIDRRKDNVRRAQDVLTHVYEADAADKTALSQLGVADLSEVIISVGQSMEASILIALHLKELGECRIMCKAISEDHEKVLRKIEVDEIVFPERYAAAQLARKLAIPGLIDYLPFGEDVILREIEVNKWEGKSLRQLDLTNEYNVQVVAIKRKGASRFSFVPQAKEELQKGDTLAVLGNEEDVNRLKS
ncbi:MAG: potassium channel family protein [Desulfonatronovibrionaceae bacterium]